MLLGAAHARREVFPAIHVESATAITGRLDSVTTLQLLHAGDHRGFVRSVVVEPVDGGRFYIRK